MHPVSLRARPYFTVSQSEAGFEKIMQAVELTLRVQLDGELLQIGLEVNSGVR